MYKLLRRGSGRMFLVCVVLLSLLLCLYYVSQTQGPSSGQPPALLAAPVGVRYERPTTLVPDYSEAPDARVSMATCPQLRPRNADIDAQREYEKFDFQSAQARLIGNGLPKLSQLIDTKLERAAKFIAAAKEKTEELIKNVQQQLETFSRGVENKITSILDMVNKNVLELIGSATDPKVSECAKLAEAFHNITEEKGARVALCAIERIGKMNEYIQEIYSVSEELIYELKGLKEELDVCNKNTTDFRQIMESIRCRKQVAFKAGWAGAKKLPVIGAYVVGFDLFVVGLPVSFSWCAARNGIETLNQNAERIFDRVRKCADERIEATANVTDATRDVN